MSTDTTAPDTTDKRRPYHWFQGPSVVQLCDRIDAAGGPGVARVEMRIHEDNSMWLRVKNNEGRIVNGTPGANEATMSPQECGDIDLSHVCPPFC